MSDGLIKIMLVNLILNLYFSTSPKRSDLLLPLPLQPLLVLLDQNVRIVLIVVEVVELHGASFERIRFDYFLLIYLSSWLIGHDDALFQEVSRCHDRIRMQLSIVLDLLYALVIELRVGFGADVRVAWAFFNRVTKLLTAMASDLSVVLGLKLHVNTILIFILFRLVLGVLAARGIGGVLAAAPPDLTTPLASVRPAAPVEILCLNVVFATALANFLLIVDFSAAHLELFHSLFHLLAINNQVLLLFFEQCILLEIVIRFVCREFHLALQVMLNLLALFDHD